MDQPAQELRLLELVRRLLRCGRGLPRAPGGGGAPAGGGHGEGGASRGLDVSPGLVLVSFAAPLGGVGPLGGLQVGVAQFLHNNPEEGEKEKLGIGQKQTLSLQRI